MNRELVFHTNTDRRTYLDLLSTASKNARLGIVAYCLMNNHVHLVAIPEEPTSLAESLRRTHGRYAAYFNGKTGRSGHLWQNRYYSCALDERHLRMALRYVERNPVRAQMVADPHEYRWSSAAAHLQQDSPHSLLDTQFAEQFGDVEGWRALLAEPEELMAIRALQRSTFSGRPLGDEGFVERLENSLGRKLTPQRQGSRNDLRSHSLRAS